MKLVKMMLKYFRGLIGAPIYLIRTYDHVRDISDHVRDISANRSIPANPIAQKHAQIYKDLERLSARRRGDLLDVDGITVRINPPRVIETVNEVILSGDYDFSTNGEHGYVLIDVGMNVGFATLMKAKDPAFTHVYGFEPLKPTYDIARANIELNPQIAKKIETFNFGLSNENKELRVKFAMDEIMSVSSEGTFDDCFAENASEEVIKVKSASEVLSPIFKKHEANRIFLKLDCEGAEFKILPELESAGLLRQCHVLVIEWHNQSPDELFKILSRNGFFYFTEKRNVEWNVGFIRAVAKR